MKNIKSILFALAVLSIGAERAHAHMSLREENYACKIPHADKYTNAIDLLITYTDEVGNKMKYLLACGHIEDWGVSDCGNGGIFYNLQRQILMFPPSEDRNGKLRLIANIHCTK
jgi:hypothetical protein